MSDTLPPELTEEETELKAEIEKLFVETEHEYEKQDGIEKNLSARRHALSQY